MSEQPPFPGDDPTLAEIVINELAFRSLNHVDHVRSETTADALDRLTERVRQGSLALYCGLSEIAQALEQASGGGVKPEAQLQRDVIELARRLGYACVHFGAAQVKPGVWATPVRGDARGFPDLVLVGAHAVLFVELKDRHGRLSDAQTAWLERLARAGQATFVWRPADWDSGEVERVLKLLAGERRCALCGAPSGSYETCDAHAGLEAVP